MSSLIPERPLVFSPSLANTIGLEEAVLLQVLNDISAFINSRQHQGYRWLSIENTELNKLMPFWEAGDISRICQSLVDKGIILLDNSTLNRPDCFCFAMNEPSSIATPNIAAPKLTQVSATASRSDSRGATLLTTHWQPDEDLLQLLQMNHNIPRDFSIQQLEDFLLYWCDRQQVSHSWGSKFRQHVLKEWRFKQSQQVVAERHEKQSKDINKQWYPSQDAMEIILRSGVSQGFIDDAIPEFVLYWQERGEAHSTWNSKFIAHIRRQWAKFTKTMELDYEPREIAANWQPSEDVYDILKLANIDVDYARQLVPEFVLFWRDTKQIHRSWNTKFLQHAKYQWASRHQMDQHYAQQQLNAGTTQAESKSTFDRLTDRSWAKDLVKGG